jgi:putative pyruvate formate lyase activating enzyme
MGESSRREFVGTCLRLSLGGLALPAAASVIGCRRERHGPAAPADLATTDAAGAESVAAADTGPAAPADAWAAFEPAFLALHRSGELRRRGEELWERMRRCNLCPRECGAARLDGDRGFCGSSAELEIAAHHPHFGEERPLVGSGGSGTVFLANCSLRCVFCINWEISQGGEGRPRTIDEMAAMMLELQGLGCLNVNLVTPTHYSPHILLAADAAAARGLRLPLLYNTCGWERLDVLRLLDGVIDIYLPDHKYADGAMAARYSSGAATYPEVTQAALLEMQRQVGTARPGPDGIIRRGLMIRHLVMPGGVDGGKEVMRWIGGHLPPDTYVNVMSQYRPMHLAFDYPEIDRRITRDEYDEVVRAARAAGLTNLDVQGYPP